MHVTYNVPAIKMYLLDLFIRDASGGQKDVTAFVRALWDTAKEFTEPQQVSEKQVVAALGQRIRRLAGRTPLRWQPDTVPPVSRHRGGGGRGLAPLRHLSPGSGVRREGSVAGL